MKRTITTMIAIIWLLLIITGCKSADTSSPEDTEDTPMQFSGETKRFEFGEYEEQRLILEVTEVASKKIGTANDGNPWEYTIYVLYPGAKLTVINADMVDGSLTENGEPHAQWRITDGIGDYEKYISITDDMEPIEITEDMKGIIGEGMYVLGFEWSKP